MNSIIESLWYSIAVLSTWSILIRFHLADRADDIGGLLTILILFITFGGGKYLIIQCDNFLWKRKVMKLARELAKYQGIDPKTLDFKNIKAEYNEELDIMEIIIEEKEKQGEE